MHQLLHFNLSFQFAPIMCDKTSVIRLYKYTVHHSKEKHFDIKHHFICGHVENSDYLLTFVDYKNQLKDIFTKPMLEEILCYLRK